MGSPVFFFEVHVSNAPPSTASVDEVSPGEMLAGKYRVERVLGRGGMGVVIAARNVELDQRVAIKCIHASLAKDGIAVERFLREGRAAVQLRSEHVAKVLDVGRLQDGVPFLVLEYLEGQDLGERLSERGALPAGDAARYLVEACEAVSEAHALGIVHRDLKPENLFLAVGLGGESNVKVLDFGVSKRTGRGLVALTQAATVVGSPMYMAPEQLRAARDLDARCDVWALGVTLRELLTGRMPFEADSVPELTLKIAHEPPRPIEDDRPGLPPELIAIVDRCLSKDREDRYADAGELATALQAYLSVERVTRTTLKSGSSGPPSNGRASQHRPQAVTLTSPDLVASRRPSRAWRAVALVAVVGSVLAVVGMRRVPPVASAPMVIAAREPIADAPASLRVDADAPPPAAAVVSATPPARVAPRRAPAAAPRRAPVVKNDEIPAMR